MNLKVEHISKSYGEQIVLQDFSCEIPEGTCTTLMGTSGSGKTTLLRLIAGLEQPDSGQILYPFPDSYRGPLAVVFQENRLCPGFDAITNIRMALPQVTPEQVREEFALVHLTEYENKPVHDLSGGMQRRVAIVRAMMTAKYADAPLALLDEPLKGLDPELYLTVRDYIKDSLKGITALLVTHNPEEAEWFGGEILSI